MQIVKRFYIGFTLSFIALATTPTGVLAAKYDRYCELENEPLVCECTKGKLMQTLGVQEFAFLAAAIGNVLKHQNAGMSSEDAWRAANEAHVKATETLKPEFTDKLDEFQQSYLDAIEECVK